VALREAVVGSCVCRQARQGWDVCFRMCASGGVLMLAWQSSCCSGEGCSGDLSLRRQLRNL
jgi:hypothetical protein